jgi:hypothetical protein
MIRFSRNRVPARIWPGVSSSTLLIEWMPICHIRNGRKCGGWLRGDGPCELDLHGRVLQRPVEIDMTILELRPAAGP